MTRSRSRWAGSAAAVAVLLAGAPTLATEPLPAPPPTAAPNPVPAVGYSATGTWQALALVNKHRRARGLRALVVDPKLASAARAWTEKMAAAGRLRHNDALFTSRSRTALGMRALGENVGWNYSVPAQHTAFLNSAGHRANVEGRGFTVAGFAVVRGVDGRIWSTQDFGTRSS